MDITHGIALRLAVEAVKICRDMGITLEYGFQKYNSEDLQKVIEKLEKKISTSGL